MRSSFQSNQRANVIQPARSGGTHRFPLLSSTLSFLSYTNFLHQIKLFSFQTHTHRLTCNTVTHTFSASIKESPSSCLASTCLTSVPSGSTTHSGWPESELTILHVLTPSERFTCLRTHTGNNRGKKGEKNTGNLLSVHAHVHYRDTLHESKVNNFLPLSVWWRKMFQILQYRTSA